MQCLLFNHRFADWPSDIDYDGGTNGGSGSGSGMGGFLPTPTPGGPLTADRVAALGIVKMNAYLVTGTRQQFWEEYFVKVIMQVSAIQETSYRAIMVVADLGWVDLDFGE